MSARQKAAPDKWIIFWPAKTPEQRQAEEEERARLAEEAQQAQLRALEEHKARQEVRSFVPLLLFELQVRVYRQARQIVARQEVLSF